MNQETNDQEINDIADKFPCVGLVREASHLLDVPYTFFENLLSTGEHAFRVDNGIPDNAKIVGCSVLGTEGVRLFFNVPIETPFFLTRNGQLKDDKVKIKPLKVCEENQ